MQEKETKIDLELTDEQKNNRIESIICEMQAMTDRLDLLDSEIKQITTDLQYKVEELKQLDPNYLKRKFKK